MTYLFAPLLEEERGADETRSEATFHLLVELVGGDIFR
jgi:hypothetical protein